ncbi:vacuolar protein sorting-associated protein 37D-like isoform X2 [Micropterus dolomieu]|uniref:vacuolar protein sorting-associated protein 37D-like isoform X2 n=1 Tax=Micropterus dolomieu TaxID=147949 RepID=UPI001E8D1C81|nr:vacuolar protein sorting-associated protein 37D-like isoform X2 [Micropterus dolomieu]
MAVMSLSVHFGALRTRELRNLLQDEDKINHIIRCSEKFQGLQRAAEKRLLSNQKMAKISLSQKTQFRDAKLLLAMKYKELEKLRSIIQAKQEQLGKHSVHYYQQCLLKKINRAEEECELLFQRFAEGKTPVADFLDSFLTLQKLQHIRLVLVKKLQEITELRSTQRISEINPETQHFSAGFPEQIRNTCLPVCSLTTAVILPTCCHPTFLLPFGTHANTVHCLQHLPFRHDYNESLLARVHGRSPKWPGRPVRLQPLKVQHSRHQQAPQ